MMNNRRFVLVAAIMLAWPLMAQIQYQEAADPHPGPQDAWQEVSHLTDGISASWGSVDVRYSRSQPVVATQKQQPVQLSAWRGERVRAQAVVSTSHDIRRLTFAVSDFKNGKHTIPASAVRKYFVRYVLSDKDRTRKDSVLMPDRLDAAGELSVQGNTTRPLWLDIHVPQDAVPGKYQARLTVSCDGVERILPLTLQVVNRTLPAPSEWAFHLDLWQNPYAVARFYGVPLWSKEHFDLMRPIMKTLAEAGGKVITCSIIQHPWNGQTEDPFESMIMKARTIEGEWKYDYTVFDRWVQFMMDCGITEQIDCYTLVPWHYKFDYIDLATNGVRYVECKPGTAEYEDFILPFLRDFAAHLKQKGWFSRTCIAMDERPMEQLQAAYDIVRRADPGYRIEGAFNYFPSTVSMIHDVSVIFGAKQLDDAVLQERRQKGMPATFYTCTGPDRPNTFTYSPTAEATFMGWYAAAVGYDGYLRWAYNSWVKNPNVDARFRTWSSGDCFLVYPGGTSIRMERLIEGIQDYEKIRILRPALTAKQLRKLEDVLRPMQANVLDPAVEAASLVNAGKAVLREIEK